jgi:hypothetical protein
MIKIYFWLEVLLKKTYSGIIFTFGRKAIISPFSKHLAKASIDMGFGK